MATETTGQAERRHPVPFQLRPILHIRRRNQQGTGNRLRQQSFFNRVRNQKAAQTVPDEQNRLFAFLTAATSAVTQFS